MNVNKVIMAGNLTHEPEVRTGTNASQRTTMRIAVNRTYTSNGERKDEATYVNIVTWGKTAEFCAAHLKKGDPVFVTGRLSIRSYEKDGQHRSTTEIIADNVQSLTRRQPQPALV